MVVAVTVDMQVVNCSSEILHFLMVQLHCFDLLWSVDLLYTSFSHQLYTTITWPDDVDCVIIDLGIMLAQVLYFASPGFFFIFLSTNQEVHPRSDLFCVEWDVKHSLNQSVSQSWPDIVDLLYTNPQQIEPVEFDHNLVCQLNSHSRSILCFAPYDVCYIVHH